MTAKKNEVAVMTKPGLVQRMGAAYGVDGGKLYETLKATAFKGGASDAQMMALMIVADQYGLNPFCREIYAFPDKNNGIVPVVGVDGWARIINSHPEFDGMEFDQDDEQCTCTIYRKDRSHPVSATEYMEECKRGTGPWQSHPKRMLRHKAMIQAARLAFGYVGIYEKDEAERIIEAVEVSPPPYREPIQATRVADESPQDDAQADNFAGTGDGAGEAGNVETGEVEAVTEKAGNTKGKDWTRYGIKVGGRYHNTFSDTDAQIAKDAKDAGIPVRIEFKENDRGFRDIVSIEGA
jgi:phage recombination protein Bet